jgi:hypothetical protein
MKATPSRFPVKDKLCVICDLMEFANANTLLLQVLSSHKLKSGPLDAIFVTTVAATPYKKDVREHQNLLHTTCSAGYSLAD